MAMVKCVEVPKIRTLHFQEHRPEQEMRPEVNLNGILTEQSQEFDISPKCFLQAGMCFNQSLMCSAPVTRGASVKLEVVIIIHHVDEHSDSCLRLA